MRRWIDEYANEWADRPNMTPPDDRPTPLTVAQRQATYRQRRDAQTAAWRAALEAIGEAPTLAQARKLAWAALSTGT